MYGEGVWKHEHQRHKLLVQRVYNEHNNSSCISVFPIGSLGPWPVADNDIKRLPFYVFVMLHVCTDGSQLVAGVGNRVLVYDAVDGDLLNALKGHKVRQSSVNHKALLQCGGRVA